MTRLSYPTKTKKYNFYFINVMLTHWKEVIDITCQWPL